jgi:hypothetical protein
MLPLAPDVPAFAVDNSKAPLDVVLYPVVMDTSPPVVADVSPAARIKFPPAPLLPEPTST